MAAKPTKSDILDPSKFYLEGYTHTFNVSSLANAASSTVLIQIDSASYFVWIKANYFCDIAAAIQTDSSRVIPLITLQINDSGANKNLFDMAQPLNNIAGEGGIPAMQSQPYVMSPNSSMSGTFTNYSASTTYTNIYFSLTGYKAYPLG